MKRQQTIIESVLTGLGLAVILIMLLNLSLTPDRKVSNSTSSTEFGAGLPMPDDYPAGEVLRAIDPTPNVPSAVHVEVGREVLCLLTVLYTEEIPFFIYKPDVPIRLSKFFFILFRTFISPNAP